MRILFLNYEFPPLGGGGANANAYLFREFARDASITVDCVTSARGAQDETVALADNITLHRLAVGKRDLHFWTQREVLTWLWRARRKSSELLASQHYDLCHAFFGFPSGMVAWLNRERLPYLVSLRGSDVPGFNPRFSAQYVVLGPLFRRIWRSANFTVANSVGLRALAHKFEPGLDIPVIPNGIDVNEFAPGAAEAGAAGRILCVSRLVARKGVQHLIEAMPAVVKARPDSHLTIVGEGDLQQPLQQRCLELGLQDKITFTGYVPHAELPALYRQAALFVQPSYYEGMSNTVLEAMASGLPIVATGEGGREELYRGNACMVSFGHPEALAAALIDLLGAPEQLRRMGDESLRIAREFSWPAVAARYVNYYRTLASQNLR